MIAPAPNDTLSSEEQVRLAVCETIIQRGLEAWIEALQNLLVIRDEKLYRGTHRTFEAYCSDRWGKSLSRIRQIRLAVETVKEIESVTGVTLKNESQARTLRQYPAHLQPAIVQIAHAEAESRGRALTGGDLRRVGDTMIEAATTGHVDTGSGVGRAFSAALTVQEYEDQNRKILHMREWQEKKERKAAGVPATYPTTWVCLFNGDPARTFRVLSDNLAPGHVARLRDYFLNG